MVKSGDFIFGEIRLEDTGETREERGLTYEKVRVFYGDRYVDVYNLDTDVEDKLGLLWGIVCDSDISLDVEGGEDHLFAVVRVELLKELLGDDFKALSDYVWDEVN